MTDQREIIWRQARPGEERPARPASSAEARARLEVGNADFAKLGDLGGQQIISVGPEAFGLPPAEGAGLAQQPFAAVLACSDARAPVELCSTRPATRSSWSGSPATYRVVSAWAV